MGFRIESFDKYLTYMLTDNKFNTLMRSLSEGKYGNLISYELSRQYSSPDRVWHKMNHAIDVLDQVVANIPQTNPDIFWGSVYAALYHDAIYDPYGVDNEAKSVEFMFEDCARNHNSYNHSKPVLDHAKKLILKTADISDSTGFNAFDRRVLLSGSFLELMEYGRSIWSEYSKYDWDVFLKGHIDVVQKISTRPEVLMYCEWLKTKKPSLGIYAGSFNPFHRGHEEILRSANKIFDKVIVARGVNPDKVDNFDGNFKIRNVPIEGVLDRNATVEYLGLTTGLVDHYEKKGYDVTLVKGLRNGSDFEYENNQLQYLKNLNRNLKVVLLTGSPLTSHISSSSIRTLQKLGVRVSEYLPCKDRGFF